MSQHRTPIVSLPLATLSACLAAAALTACGGGGADAPQSTAQAEAAPVTSVAAVDGVAARPTFHMAAAQLDEPDDADVAAATPHRFQIDGALAGVPTAGLTPARLAERLATLQRARAQSAGTRPAAAISAAVYTPAQIRAAYGLPPLPVVGSTVSAADAPTYGAGQTIYIVDAYDHPNAAADLARFSSKFGLPGCTTVAATRLPLAAASSTAGCTFSVAYSDSRGGLNAAAPAYNADWIAEIALDVEWSHAIAPLARIVLIEVSAADSNSLAGGVALANKMGAGVVSMSFGAVEGSWVPSMDATFGAAGMTYVAAAGDNGAQALWPAVSPRVLAVGGTSLQWNGSGTRYEAAWSGSGGAVSAYETLPTWQQGLVVPGLGAAKMRAVSDVAFNANPTTGQYVALTAKGSTTTSWNAYGGTSIGAPQWAGLVAVANARRVAAAKAVLGDFHTALYKSIAGTPGTYSAAFDDIVDGSDGSCASCKAATGYDTVTGWGTPNGGALLTALVGADAASTIAATTAAPVVPGGAFSAQTGTAFSQSLRITAPAGVTTTYALAGAPRGLAVNAAGTLSWAVPVAGSYTFTATATAAGKSASGKYTLAVVAVNHAPTLGSASISVRAGVSLTVLLRGSDVDGDALTYTMTGAPAGMTLTPTGTLAWSKTVKGRYAVKVTAKDARGLSSAPATITVVVS